MKKRGDNALFIFFWVIAVVFIVSPVLLKCDWFYKIADGFLECLKYQEYKGAFISAIGGMIGSGLAVTSAIWLQKRTEIKQKEDVIKRSATIIYYDIELFYRENDILANRIKEILNEKDLEVKLQNYIKLKNYAGIHIDDNWINNVAELVTVLDENTIRKIYLFYGRVSELGKIIYKSENEINEEDLKRVYNIFYTVGMKNPYYRPQENIRDVLDELNRLRGSKEKRD